MYWDATETSSVHLNMCYFFVQFIWERKNPKQTGNKERKIQMRDQVLAVDRHIRQVKSSLWTRSILTLTVSISHSMNLLYNTISHSRGVSSSSCFFFLSLMHPLFLCFCPCLFLSSTCRPPLRLSLSLLLSCSSSLLDVEDLCRKSVVPVLQLGKARPFHLWLKPLSDGEEGRTRLLH